MTTFCSPLLTFADFAGFLGSGRPEYTTFATLLSSRGSSGQRFLLQTRHLAALEVSELIKVTKVVFYVILDVAGPRDHGIGPPPPQSSSSVIKGHSDRVLSNLCPFLSKRALSTRVRISEEE